MQSAKERESKKVNEEILQLLTQPTAKVTDSWIIFLDCDLLRCIMYIPLNAIKFLFFALYLTDCSWIFLYKSSFHWLFYSDLCI